MHPLHKKICPECEVPYIWTKDSVLDDDNTTLQKMIPVRGVFYEVSEIDHLLRGLEEAVGLPLDQVYFTAHKRAITQFFNGTLKGKMGNVARRIASRFIYLQIAQVSPNFGVGRSVLDSYSKGKSLEMHVSNVWNPRLFAADIAGAWNAVERTSCRVSSEQRGDILIYRAHVSSTPQEEHVGRLIPITGVLMGSQDYPVCQACGSPQSFQIFRWERESGSIKERDNGIRVVHQTIGCLDSIMHELELELGKEVREMAIRSQADYVRGLISQGAYDRAGNLAELSEEDASARFYRYLALIKRRCMGNPFRVDISNGQLEVVVRNPANKELVLGRILGTYEALEGLPGELDWREVHGTIIARVSPRP